jgi:predicted metal-dependent hydrolase
VSAERIQKIVKAKSYWIQKNLAEWRELNAIQVVRNYRNGEGFCYLGRSYRLLLVPSQEAPLQLKDGRFCLRRQLGDTEARQAFRNFYIGRGKERIPERVHYYAAKIGVSPVRITIKELGHRWASCSPHGNLAFHWKCMMVPQTIIDYIVVHELCHLHHLNHTHAFWNEVDKVMRDYPERKAWLKKNGAAMNI